ncbi:CHAT domain-containing protein [Phormidium tenue FACHB-886]|nr:CHAT domain-containing protein [Phormidium tenue FACHB-886]
MRLRFCCLVALAALLTVLPLPTLNKVQAVPSPAPAPSPTATPEQANPRQIEAAQLMLEGILQMQRNQYQESLQNLQASLQIYQELDEPQGQFILLNSLGSVYFYLGRYQESIAASQQSIELLQALGDAPEAAIGRSFEMVTLTNLGLSHQYLGQYQQAIDFLQRALTAAQQANQPLMEATALVHLGDAYRTIGKYEQAVQVGQQALTVLRSSPQVPASPPAAAAQNPLEALFAPALATGAQQAEAGALANLGIAYGFLKDYPQSIAFLQQSLELAKEIGDRQIESRALLNLGNTYLSAEQPQQAAEAFRQAIALAKEIGDRQGEAIALGNLGNSYRNLGEFEQAIDSHQQSLAIKRELGDRAGEAISLSNLAYALLNEGQPQDAELLLWNSVEILESLRTGLKSDTERVALQDTQRYAYENLQNALVMQNKIEQALEVAERGRARAFVELLSRHQLGSADSSAVPSMASPSIDEIKRIARSENATLIEYSIIDQKTLFIWVIQPTGKITFRQTDFNATFQQPPSRNASPTAAASASPAEDPFTSLVSTTRSAVIADRSAPVADLTRTNQLRTLHQFLIEPIADLLPTDPNDRLIFIPQGSLFLVPFPALQDEAGTYLIKNHTILTAPAIQVLGLTGSDQNSDRPPALIIGNPVMPKLPTSPGEPPQPLPALPAAGTEATLIAQLLNVQALEGDQATETAVVQQMPAAKIVHLATHGLLNYGQPDEFGILDTPGAIALAPSNTDDGLLTASEILKLNLQADLVVLSACDTGRGRITEDGVVGLSRSFMAAGAASVVVSLWSASDLATADLMTKFYQQLQQNPDKAQALRQAMLATMEQYPHPRDWAAFTLMGKS